ncbi:PREDICTED: chromatin accessibility complex protein 1 [Nelumbo nucifera]|uniref:Transcription factor CBF/NF-Y/archaeal histone domain-containing protein n=2 Tax=Nelumbo nucifera TaxID=4432 RepID=A0A822Z8W3_NELNU|nr:PREDICTED: chromatin accessibility complex protein 1 [Nelumbo nucifera]DAD40141.1 TPA_asm: hypothetical protein HUJ06_014464 [Nelumbo nucifera]
MADAEEENTETLQPAFPLGRVKKIMKLDNEIKKVNSEALLLVSLSTDLFLRFLAEKSAGVAVEKKRKIVKLEHLRIAVKKHEPTKDFLLDSLPMPSQVSTRPSTAESRPKPTVEKAVPAGTHRIDDFFHKCSNGISNQTE